MKMTRCLFLAFIACSCMTSVILIIVAVSLKTTQQIYHTHETIYHFSSDYQEPLGHNTTISIAYYFQDPRQPIDQSEFVRRFLLTCCQKSSKLFRYNIILGFKTIYDTSATLTDLKYSLSQECSNVDLTVNPVEIQGNVLEAVNGMFFELAYLKDYDFYFHVINAFELEKNWDIKALTKFGNSRPPGIGAFIFTRDNSTADGIMIHKTHYDLYNRFYPLGATGLGEAMAWMKSVYGSLALVNEVTTSCADLTAKDKLKSELDKRLLLRYLKVADLRLPPPSGKRVVSMSLYGADPRYTVGAIRNAQLIKVNYPIWTLRVYIEKPNGNGKTMDPKVPDDVIKKLKSLGAKIEQVDQQLQIPPMMWRFLAMDDLTLDYVIIRDSDSRLTRRDAIVTHGWIMSGKTVHCIRDHPHHGTFEMLGGLWGAKPKELRDELGSSFKELMNGYHKSRKYMHDMKFLADCVLSRLSTSDLYCHDSVTCRKWRSSHPFPVSSSEDFIGPRYSRWQRVGDIPKRHNVEECMVNLYDITDTEPLLS